jgi:hypothetical protein
MTGPTDQHPTAEWPIPSAPIEAWGKDHWTTLAYLQSCVVTRQGHIDRMRMRGDKDRHPGLWNGIGTGKYPTRLKGGEELRHHDDFDCLDDLHRAGLVIDLLTGIGNGVVGLTDLGRLVCEELRVHRDVHNRGSGAFTPSTPLRLMMEANLEMARVRAARGEPPVPFDKDIARFMAGR